MKIRNIARVGSRTINLAIAALVLALAIVAGASSANAQTRLDAMAEKYPEGVVYAMPDWENRVLSRSLIRNTASECEGVEYVQRCFYLMLAKQEGVAHANYYYLVRVQVNALGFYWYEFTHMANLGPKAQ